jgi:type IV pilus assembly protein PilQ
MPAYRAVRKARGLEVVLSEKTVASAPAASPAATEMVAEIDGQRIALDGAEAPVSPAPNKRPVDLEDLRFEESPTGGKLSLKLSGTPEFKVERPDAHSAVLTLENARLPKRLERSLDTSALGTPVKMVSAFSVPGKEGKVRVVVASDGNLSEEVAAHPNALTWQLSSDKRAEGAEVATSAPKTASLSAEAPAVVQDTVTAQGRSHYTGRRVSFEFKDIDIQNLLRVIAEVSRKNVVVADDVQGKVTIRLRNVPWDQALELILRSKGLGKEEIGNIIRVAPLKTLEEEAKLRAERRRALEVQEELVVQLIPVNYAVAQEMSLRVKDVLSARGSVAVDARTNTLIVRDVASNINRARSLVQNLDTQTPQVLIESRIVEANTNFTRQIGVQWGGQGSMSPATGNATGLAFPNAFGVAGGVSGTAPGQPSVPNYAVNLPAAVGQGQGGALGFVFGSAGGALGINLRLSALENEGAVKTISAPKVTTLDNITARISQGLSIPFSQVSAAGVNTTFVEARLSLEVTPHITQDSSILMNIRAENNQPDPSNTGANGQPAIQRKEASTQVLVKDGETTVIGGIYVRRGATQTSMVPFLGRIPILGFFFRTDSQTESRQELLIFITPRIINRQTVAQTL